MPTVRQQILQNIKTVCEGIDGINKVFVNNSKAVDVAIHPLPILFIDSISADKQDEAALDDETWLWRILIELWAVDVDMETWLGTIHDALMLDPRRGGYATDTERMSDDVFDLDETDSHKRLLMFWEIGFYNERGLSSQQ